MAHFSLHNVKSVSATGNTFDTFCTLKLSVATQHKYDKEEIFEQVEFYFDDEQAREAFMQSISNAIFEGA
jgi:hypothetical protein